MREAHSTHMREAQQRAGTYEERAHVRTSAARESQPVRGLFDGGDPPSCGDKSQWRDTAESTHTKIPQPSRKVPLSPSNCAYLVPIVYTDMGFWTLIICSLAKNTLAKSTCTLKTADPTTFTQQGTLGPRARAPAYVGGPWVVYVFTQSSRVG